MKLGMQMERLSDLSSIVSYEKIIIKFLQNLKT